MARNKENYDCLLLVSADLTIVPPMMGINQVTTPHLKMALPMMVQPGKMLGTGYSNQITPPSPTHKKAVGYKRRSSHNRNNISIIEKPAMLLPRPGLFLGCHFWYIQDDANFFRGLAHERARHLKAGEVKKGFYGMERQGGDGADSGLEKK